MEHTETLIVEQLKIGNEDAYQYIYDRHYALLCHIANGYVKDQFLAETIVGDTIFHLWEIRETLEISVSIRSYLSMALYISSSSSRSNNVPNGCESDTMILSSVISSGIRHENEISRFSHSELR